MSRLFYLLLFSVFFTIWILECALADVTRPWAPFVGPKIAFLMLGLCVIGSAWINLAAILGLLIEALILWKYNNLTMNPFVAGVSEPYTTCFYALSGVLILHLRSKYREISRELAYSQARESLLDQMTKMFLTIRDQTNSPIQTILIGLSLIQKPDPEDVIGLEKIQQGVEKLIKFNEIFKELEAEVRWDGSELLNTQEFLQSFKKDD